MMKNTLYNLWHRTLDDIAYVQWRINAKLIWLLYPQARRRYRRYCTNVMAKGRGTFPFHHWLYEVSRLDANRN
jgi:hypothetical protein